MYIHKLEDPTYWRDIRFVIGTEKEIIKWCDQVTPHDPWTDVAGRYFQLDGVHYVVATRHKDKNQVRAILAHEILHLTFAVLADAGLKVSDDSEEAYTYYFQNLLFQALQKLK